MDKDTFNKLDTMDQIEFVNKKLKEGYSLSKLDNENIISSRKTVSNRFKKVGYELNKETNQYENTIEIVKPEAKEIITTNTQKQESSNLVVLGDQVNNKALEQIILNYADMNNKLNEVYDWYQKSSNNVVIEDKLEIDDFEGKVVVRSYKLYESIQKEFAEFCASSKYRVQDIVSQAFKEFLDKYK